MITVIGIKSCDSCRKALAWLRQNGLAHRFHDLRVDGLDAKQLLVWIEACGWENLLNRRSTTWRSLDDSDKQNLDADKAALLMTAHPTLIKRPVFAKGDVILVGFTDAVRDALI